MGFVNYAIVRFSVFLALGILAGYHFPISVFAWYPLLILFGITIFLWYIARKQFIQTIYYGIAVYTCFFVLGYFTFQLKEPEFQSEHYSQSVTKNEPQLIQIKIRESLKPDAYNDKYFADVQAIDGHSYKGKILFSIAKDSLDSTIALDETLLIYAAFSTIQAPLNPHQFDYAKYMRNLEVHDQIRISKSDIITMYQGKRTLFGMAQNLRSKIIVQLKKANLNDNERAIIQALILGEKKDIDKQLYEEYAAAGAVHILAVSGLHVGIIFIILTFLLSPLTRFKHGAIFRSLLIVAALWSFALLAGLSPSVVRAVSMFSFFALAMILGRRTNALNTLFLSFLFLLLINPLWLFQVGFQLSYMAVFFILWFQPIFKRIKYSRYYMVRKFSGIITVSLSAQIGVFPLSLYYFHQFPGLFLLTNLIVLPTLAIYMAGGLLIVGLAYWNILPDWLAKIYGMMVEGLNSFIGWVASQESFLFSDIHFSTLKLVGAYLLIVAFGLWLRKSNYQRLMLTLCSISVLISIYIYDKATISDTQLLVFHKNRSTFIGYKTGNRFVLFTKDSTANTLEEYPIRSYKTAMNLQSISEESIPRIFKYNAKTIIVLDSFPYYPMEQQAHTIVLTNSPKINFDRLIDSIKPQQIVVDGSNYPSYVERWQKTSLEKNVSFHYTAKEGAYTLD